MEFLWEYHNPEIKKFAVKYLCYASNLRRLEGQPSIAEEFAEKNGIQTRRVFTDHRGKKFWIDKKTGKYYKVRRKVPYLRLVVSH